MGDSKTVVAETSADVTYTSAGYADNVSNPVPEAGSSTVPEYAGEAAQANSTYAFGYSNVGDGNAYGGDPNSVLQAQFNKTDDSKLAVDTNETSSGLGNTATESTQVSDYNSSVNGGVAGAVANTT